MKPPWRFSGVYGPVVLHPDTVVVAFNAMKFKEHVDDIDRLKTVGVGSTVTVRLPGDSESCVFDVLETPEIVEEQLRQRGGWESVS